MGGFSTGEQVEAIVNGTIGKLLRQYYPALEDYRKAITVTREDLESYLLGHPAITGSLLSRRLAQEPIHEQILIIETAHGYEVGESDHGTPIFLKPFSSREKALADVLLSELGM
ncbi:MAG TPA: hypothetical protein VFX12_03815 [Vicinamibacterales bacterium]|nr:hypothetical protein [Vicinamibacterales bacterium]